MNPTMFIAVCLMFMIPMTTACFKYDDNSGIIEMIKKRQREDVAKVVANEERLKDFKMEKERTNDDDTPKDDFKTITEDGFATVNTMPENENDVARASKLCTIVIGFFLFITIMMIGSLLYREYQAVYCRKHKYQRVPTNRNIQLTPMGNKPCVNAQRCVHTPIDWD